MRELPLRLELAQPRQPHLEALPHDVLEVLVEREAGGHVEVREVVLLERQVDVAAFCDPDRPPDRIRVIRKHGQHLFRGLQIELIAVILQAVDVGDRLPGADAEQDVVRLEVRVLQVVNVVGDDELEPQVFRNRLQAGVDDLLLVDALILHLEEEILAPEDVAVRCGRGNGLVLLLRADAGCHLPLEAAAQTDQSFGVLREQRLVDTRLVVETLGIAGRDELDKVVVPLRGLGEQHQVIGRLTRRSALRAPIARRDVDFAPENRIDPALPRVIVKHHRREHVPVLGDRHRGHLQLDGLVEQFLDPAGPIEQRKLGVQVEVDEFTHCMVLDGARLSIDGLVDDRCELDSPTAIVQSTINASTGVDPQSALCNRIGNHLLPLDGRRRLRRDVVHHTIDPFDLVDDAR